MPKIRTVKRREHFLFNLLCFLYFRRSSSRGIETRPVGALIAVPYVLFSEAYFLRTRRYFIIIDQQIVGLFALEEEAESIFISALATNPFYRRTGVASLILKHAVTLARKLGKTHLELAVTKRNIPASKLYNKFGFQLKEEKRRSYILQYHV